MKKWLILLTICLDWSLMWIDFTAVNVALAPIANDLHTNLNTLQWVITAYTLCSALFMTLGGRLGDIYGHRRLFIIGTLIFVISSVLAGLSPNAGLLILSRVGQGIGIALVVPITTALVYLTFDQTQRGMALGILTGTTGISMAIGPTVGGLLITYLNWRWVFFINLPIGLFAIFMALLLIKGTARKQKVGLDFAGIITLIIGLFTLLLAINKVAQWGLNSYYFWGLLLISALFIAAFIRIEIKQSNPLIHIDLLTNKVLLSVISIRSCAQYIFFVYMFILGLYLQNILKYSADTAGYLFLAATIILGIASPFAGKLINHYSLRSLIAISCFIIALSLIALMLSNTMHSISYLLLSLILFGIGYAIHFPATNFAALQTAPSNQAALVTGMLFTMAFASASTGITLSSTLLTKLSEYKLSQILSLKGIILTENQYNLAKNIASGALSLNDISKNHLEFLIDAVQKAFSFGFMSVLMSCLLLAIIGVLLAISTLKKNKNTKHNQSMLEI